MKAACNDDQEKAIVLTLCGTGMRVNELCNLRIEDIDFERGYIRSRWPKEAVPGP